MYYAYTYTIMKVRRLLLLLKKEKYLEQKFGVFFIIFSLCEIKAYRKNIITTKSMSFYVGKIFGISKLSKING